MWRRCRRHRQQSADQNSNRRPKTLRRLRYHSTGGCVIAMSLPTAWSLLNSCLCCPLGPGLRCCVGPWSWLWLRLGFWDVKMLGTRILIKTQKKLFVYAFSSLCHRYKRGGDQCLVPLASLWWLWSSRWPPFGIFSWFYTIFIVVLNICFQCLSFFTHTSTQQQTRRKLQL